MPITVEQIVREAQRWPPERVDELVSRLIEDLHTSEPGVEVAWAAEIARRVEDVQGGRVHGLAGAQVSARVGKAVGR